MQGVFWFSTNTSLFLACLPAPPSRAQLTSEFEKQLAGRASTSSRKALVDKVLSVVLILNRELVASSASPSTVRPPPPPRPLRPDGYAAVGAEAEIAAQRSNVARAARKLLDAKGPRTGLTAKAELRRVYDVLLEGGGSAEPEPDDEGVMGMGIARRSIVSEALGGVEAKSRAQQERNREEEAEMKYAAGGKRARRIFTETTAPPGLTTILFCRFPPLLFQTHPSPT